MGDKNGGTITLTAGNLPNNYHLTIRRVRGLTQDTDIRNQGDFFPEVIEDEFDRNIMIAQQQQEELDRSFRLPETVTGVSARLPIPEAGKIPAWNSTATALENLAPGELPASVTLFDASLTLAGSTLGVTNPVLRAAGAGTVDAITATASPVPAALVNNLTVDIEATGANATTTPTLSLNNLGAKTIVKGSDAALLAGDIPGANYKMRLSYDASLDKWVLMNPYFSRAEAQSGSLAYIADTGAADAYVATLVPAPIANPEGMEVAVKIANANLTTTPTLNVNGIGAGTIVRENSAALIASDLPAGHIAVFRRKGTTWLLLNPCTVATVPWTALPDGATVNTVTYQRGDLVTGATTVPNDDTIPQNTEGNEYLTLAITPKSATSKLVIEVLCPMSISAGTLHAIGSIFQDTTAGALASVMHFIGSANTIEPFVLRHTMIAGTTSATTFKFRVGPESAATITVNGLSGARKLGGVSAATITITEVKAS